MSQPSPTHFFETVTAYQCSYAVKTAVELGLFTAIAEGATTARAIAERCAVAERGARILCDYMVAYGFLTKEDGQYGLTPESALYLNRHSPAYMGTTVDFLLSPMLMESFSHLSEAVRRGGTMLPDQGSVTPENPVWVQFARAMMPMMMGPARAMEALVKLDQTRGTKLLDIAAGHGIFGIVFAQQNPQLEVWAVDWPSVLEVAAENATRFGVAGRHHLLPGSAFDVEFGEDYDLVLLTNFLHHFDIETNVRLLQKAYASLREDGRVLTLEFVPNEDRVTPRHAAGFSLVMLASTPNGEAYTFAEYDEMMKRAGFSHNELHCLDPLPSSLIVSTK